MTTHERDFGRYFEDFEIGDVYKHWPGKTITEYDDHLFCMITMNHHPVHTNAWFAEHDSPHGKNLVVGNLVYSLVLGMSVPDISGSAIANLEVDRPQAREADVPRRHHLRREPGRRQEGVVVEARPRGRHRGDQGLQPARRRGLLVQPQGHGLEEGRRTRPPASVRRRHLGLRWPSTTSPPVGSSAARRTTSADDRATPPSVIDVLRERCGLGPGCDVVDIAAGTGKFTQAARGGASGVGRRRRARRRHAQRARGQEPVRAGRGRHGRGDRARRRVRRPRHGGAGVPLVHQRRGRRRARTRAAAGRVPRAGVEHPRRSRCRGRRRSTRS